MSIDLQAAAVGFTVALLLVVLLTPGVSLLAWRLGLLDHPGERRLHEQPVPRLGGLAIFAGVAIPALAIGRDQHFTGIMLGATIMVLIGALDDVHALPPFGKLVGQVAAAAVPVWYGVVIDDMTLPIVGAVDLDKLSAPLSLLWIVAIANIVNFIDGVDGLAAGFCAIAGITFAILSASLGHAEAAALAAVVAGAAAGFLRYNFYPAVIIMGDSGSLVLGYLIATVAIEGVVKTAAAVSLVFPLLVLALPIIDTSFVVLKRLKHGKPIYQADLWHLHHRFANIGFGQRRTVTILYLWCGLLSVFALAIRFVPHKSGWGPLDLLALGTLGTASLAFSLYVVYLLEIIKLRHLQALGLARKRAAQAPPAGEGGNGLISQEMAESSPSSRR